MLSLRKQAKTRSRSDWEDHQTVLVDQATFNQRLSERRSTMGEDRFAELSL
jgi:hypothetical protein